MPDFGRWREQSTKRTEVAVQIHRGGIGRHKGGLTDYRLRYCSMNHPDKGSQSCKVQILTDGIYRTYVEASLSLYVGILSLVYGVIAVYKLTQFFKKNVQKHREVHSRANGYRFDWLNETDGFSNSRLTYKVKIFI